LRQGLDDAPAAQRWPARRANLDERPDRQGRNDEVGTMNNEVEHGGDSFQFSVFSFQPEDLPSLETLLLFTSEN
jgi:hypothetical protein